MAKKKAELEADYLEYKHWIRKAREAERAGLFHQALEDALAAWPYVDGMMQYGKRYREEVYTSIAAIDLVLKYSPLLLDYPILDRLQAMLKEQRRIDKNTSESIADKLAVARQQMWRAYELWGHLEENPDGRQDFLRKTLGGDQAAWRGMSERWEEMGLLSRKKSGRSYELIFTTRLGEVIHAKCESCGEIVEGPKGMFL